MRSRPKLLLSGFMGTGKSTVGHLVASRAGVAFLDLDARIEEAAGAPIAAIFADRGEPAFRALEAEALRAALTAEGVQVIAVGGGALLDPTSRRLALDRARVVTLTARPRTIVKRTAGDTSRPLLAADPGSPPLPAAELEERIRELQASRSAVYAEAHARIATDALAPHEVANLLARSWADPILHVSLGAESYGVRLTTNAPTAVADVVSGLDPSSVFVITDTNVRDLTHGELEDALGSRGVRVGGTVALPPGEEHKHLGAVEHALSAMVAQGADRDAVVVAHGGGVVSDVAGFSAATLLRGVRWVVVPTTLLGMVDASVGGKTGVDLGVAKNAVGAFHQPSAVVVAPAYVATESPRAYASGLAEVVKSAAIADPGLFELLESQSAGVIARDPEIVEQLVLRSIAVKAAIVGRDPHEQGERAVLNFGHTVGHALEAEGNFTRLTHGEAVGLGMIAALRVGVALGFTDAALLDRVTALLARLGLPADLSSQPLKEALPLVALDKKRKAGLIRFVLLRGLGAPFFRWLSLADLTNLLVSTRSVAT